MPHVIQLPQQQAPQQSPPETVIGKALRDAVSLGQLTPALAQQLVLKAADMVDSLGATLMGSHANTEALVKQLGDLSRRYEIAVEAIATRDSEIKTLRGKIADLNTQLETAQASIGELAPLEADDAKILDAQIDDTRVKPWNGRPQTPEEAEANIMEGMDNAETAL